MRARSTPSRFWLVFARDTGGVAAVEFALIASLLVTMMSGGYDLSRLMTAKRDGQRAAVEVSQTLAACTTSPCVLTAGQTITSREANAFQTITPLVISWAYVSRVNNVIIVSFGNMTALPGDLETAAKAALPGNNDNGVCSMVTTTIAPLGFLNVWPSGTFGDKRYFVCTLQSKNVKVV